MHPALGMTLERVVPPSGATICGESIPGGTLVGCNAWVVQRDRKTFGEDCDSYRPERWLEDADSTRKMERAMLQFGAGNHVCLGQNIAFLEIYKLVPSLLRTYEVGWSVSDTPLIRYHPDILARWKTLNCSLLTNYMLDFSC